jgi:uncharacterized caspase-like protein
MTRARAALIVASNEYDDPMFSRLRAPVHDAEALARVLRNPEIGGFEVRTLLNGAWHVVREEIEGFCAEHHREDLLLLYFSCHGVKDVNGQLYFAARDTKFRRLSATGIASSFVKEQMDQSRSKRIVLLLDCCYSGAFARGLAPRVGQGVDVMERFEGNGRAIITASSAMEYAFEGFDVANVGDTSPSVFTSAIVRGLETGEADRDRDGQVSVDDLYEFVYDEVRRASPSQTPSMFATLQGALHLAKNPHLTYLAQLPAELRPAVESEFPSQRETAVARLAALLASGSSGVVRSARAALDRLADDDSRRVSEAARRALATASERRTDTPERKARPAETGPAAERPAVVVTHGGPPIRRVALSPDGARLATASDDKTARVWEVPTSEEIVHCRHAGLLNWVLAVAYHPDGDRLATGTVLRVACLWQVSTGREIGRVRCEEAIRCVSFSPDGDSLATASDDATARVWSLATGSEVVRVRHAQLVHAVAFDPSGHLLATPQ